MGVRTSTGRSVVVAGLTVTLVCLALAGQAAGLTVLDERAGPSAVETPGTAGNNTTVQHVDPDSVDESGDLDATTRWFERRLASQLERSSVSISQGQYDQARSIVSEDVQDTLGRYVDVAGETDADGDGGETVDRLQTASERQDEYVDAVTRYERTYEEYTSARERGADAESRRLARRLGRIERNVSTTGTNLTRDYDRVANSTGRSLQDGTRSVETTVAEIDDRQSTVREATFDPTRLSVRAIDRRTSFVQPLELRGQLTGADGEPLDVETALVTVGGRTYQPDLGENGTFSLQYRPVVLPAGTERLTVAYRPAPTSPNLGSNASVETEIVTVEPTLAITVNRTRLRFGEDFTVSGRATVSNRSIPDLPMVVTLEDRIVGQARTTESGRFVVTGSLPADVATGDRTLTARVAVEDRAVASGQASTAVTVEREPTQLTLETTTGRTLRASGTLTTSDGRAVANRSVALSIDGERVGTARTDGEGDYRTSIDRPATVEPGDEVEVDARFEATGTNLAPASASARVVLSAGGESLPLLPIAGLVTLVAIAAGGFWIARRRTGSSDADATETSVEDEAATGEAASAGPAIAHQLLEGARAAHRDGQSRETVELAYAAVRSGIGGAPAATHWEFLRAHSDALDSAEADTLRELTTIYERVVYAEQGEDDAGEAALACAERLV